MGSVRAENVIRSNADGDTLSSPNLPWVGAVNGTPELANFK